MAAGAGVASGPQRAKSGVKMPYKSRAQAAFFHIHKRELERQGVNVAEWDAASKGKKLPKHKHKAAFAQPRKG